MRKKWLIALVVLSSLTGYLEWGDGQKMLLIHGEIEVFKKLFQNPIAAVHPLTLLPLFGQGVLIFSLFQRPPKKAIVYTGLACIALLMLIIFAIGILKSHHKIFLSSLPFFLCSLLLLREYKIEVEEN